MSKHEITAKDAEYMQMAIDLSIKNVDEGGGPFGAVIIKDDKVIATGVNRVVPENDPTAHAEVRAIRRACQELKTFKLTGATIYSSCEPCPMCMSAIYWAGIHRLCYGNTKEDAAAIDFDDSFIYDQLDLAYEQRTIKCEHFMGDKAILAFQKWHDKSDKVEY